MGIHAGNRSRPAYSGTPRFQFPPNVLQLFKPRDLPRYQPPAKVRRLRPMEGMASLVDNFESPEEYKSVHETFVAKGAYETPARRVIRKRRERRERIELIVENKKKEYAPEKDATRTEDPYKTLFVARLAPETTESKLRRELETYGSISTVIMPVNPDTQMPTGYAFVEYERQKDLKEAYKAANGRRIDGQRVVVDVERARTVRGWLPLRLSSPYPGKKATGDGAKEYDGERHPDRHSDRHSEAPSDRHAERQPSSDARARKRGRDH